MFFEKTDVLLIIILGTMSMLIMTVTIVFFVILYNKTVHSRKIQIQLSEAEGQKNLLKACIQAEIKERERIAKNIHDDVGPLLNVLLMGLDEISNANFEFSDPDKIKLIQNSTKELVGCTIESLRGIMNDVMPTTLTKLGFVKALEELCNHVFLCSKIDAKLVVSREVRLSKNTELQLYRVVQELVNNVLKHAGPTEIRVVVSGNEINYFLLVCHNGKGLTSKEVEELSAKSHGLGLKNIQSRVQFLNGEIGYYQLSEDEYGIFVEFADENVQELRKKPGLEIETQTIGFEKRAM